MIKRYRHKGGVIYIKTKYISNTLNSSTVSTATYTSVITGEPGSVVTFQVTTYSSSHSGNNYTIDGVTKVLNDVITRTLDGTGSASLTQFIDVGTTSTGFGIDVVLTITATTIGTIDTLGNTTNISRTT